MNITSKSIAKAIVESDTNNSLMDIWPLRHVGSYTKKIFENSEVNIKNEDKVSNDTKSSNTDNHIE